MTKYWILWLTIHSPLLCGLLLVRCQYLHRFNIVQVGHPTLDFRGYFKFCEILCRIKVNYKNIRSTYVDWYFRSVDRKKIYRYCALSGCKLNETFINNGTPCISTSNIYIPVLTYNFSHQLYRCNYALPRCTRMRKKPISALERKDDSLSIRGKRDSQFDSSPPHLQLCVQPYWPCTIFYYSTKGTRGEREQDNKRWSTRLTSLIPFVGDGLWMPTNLQDGH